jgi:signal transduction histidine kinase
VGFSKPVQRLAISGRAYVVAAVVGLALASGDRATVQSTIILAAIAAIAAAATLLAALPSAWVITAEAAMASLTIGAAMPDGQPLLPYLVVPALIGGTFGGLGVAAAAVSIEAAALVLFAAIPGGLDELVRVLPTEAPWLLTALAAGLLGSWFAKQQAPTGAAQVDETYEAARKLLSQLRTIARRLSSGLDSVSLASQLMITAHQHLNDTQSAVFVRTESDLLSPLGYSTPAARESISPIGPVIDACFRSESAVCAAQPSGSADRRYLVAFPLRATSTLIGVLVSECPEEPSARKIEALQTELGVQSLRLDAALAFDEVRSLATLEERQRLAREIHDGVAQEVASLGYSVDELLASATSDQQRARLTALRGEITRVVSELRHSIFDLRAEISPTAGLGSALSEYVREVGARSGITVHLTLDEAPTRLRTEAETELFRIAQEAITNARKHSHGRNLWVDCRIRPPAAEITVRDDGLGLGDSRKDSYGVQIMHERAARIGARLEILDRVGGRAGTTVRVKLGELHAVQPGQPDSDEVGEDG